MAEQEVMVLTDNEILKIAKKVDTAVAFRNVEKWYA